MATNTYVELKKTTLTTSTTTVEIASIPQDYTDLVLVMVHKGTGVASAANGYVRFNSDSGSNYSKTQMLGVGVAQSQRASNATQINWPFDETEWLVTRFNIMNYANTTTFKTTLIRQDAGTYGTAAVVGLWRSTSAINAISLTASDNQGGGTPDQFVAGSTFSLYGIKAQVTPGTAKATGGTISYDNFGNVYHTFTSSGTFQPLEALTCDYVVVAGGGGGGTRWAGGGGAGGLRSTFGVTGGGGSLEAPITLSPSNYSITVGGPGAGATGVYVAGTQGNNSTFSSITSTGGGGGGTSSAYATIGGSGGAGGMRLSGLAGLGAAGTTGQGYAGGNAASSGGYAGGGGGGAGAIGGTADNNNFSNAGDGGNGVTLYVGGSALSLAGGGGGGSEGGGTFWGAGGLGGGGNGNSSAGQGGNGTVNTGGGGGGGGNDSGTGGSGGSGIVIIRYSGV